jgi:hypothetical protein
MTLVYKQVGKPSFGRFQLIASEFPSLFSIERGLVGPLFFHCVVRSSRRDSVSGISTSLQ